MMRNKPYRDVDFCKYGMPYGKRTRIWNNLDAWVSSALCNRDCRSMMENGRRHKEGAQRVPNHGSDGNPDNRRRWRQDEVFPNPSALVAEIEAWLRASLRQ